VRRESGTYVSAALDSDRFRAFVPAPLPPAPPIAFDRELEDLRDRATTAA
jgi:hypothetical protein